LGLAAILAPKIAYKVITWLAVDYGQWGNDAGLAPLVLVLLASSLFLSVAVLALALLPPVRWAVARWHQHRLAKTARMETFESQVKK
jgi:hypothetical protein